MASKSVFLLFLLFSVLALSGMSLVSAQTPSPGSPVAVTPDSTPPTFESAALDEGTGVLAITFDEIIANEGFDLSTASYTDRSFSVSNKDSSPTGMAFNTNGTKMFVAGYNTGKIYEYELTTPFDVSSSDYKRDFSVFSEENTPEDVAFNPAGTKMFVVGAGSDKVNEYTLTTPFNLSTASYTRNFSVSSEDTYPEGVVFNPAGTKMFVVGSNYGNVYEYTLTTPFNVSTAAYTDNSFSVSNRDPSPSGVAFNPAGTKMFVVGYDGYNVNEYTLTTPFDISNVSHTGTLLVRSQDGTPADVAFNPAGTKMFVVGYAGGNIHEYTLTTPVDLSKLFISETGSVNGTGTALSGASIETVGNSTSIEIKLTAPQLQSVIALTTPELDILAAAVSDVSGNEILASYDNIIAVTNSVAAVSPPPLAAPTGLSVFVFAIAADITWTAPAISANSFYDISNVSYIVYVTDVADGTTVQHTVPVGTTGHTTNLILGKSYEVTVEAKALLSDSTVLSSQPTAAVSFDMPLAPLPDAPTNLLVNVINGTAAEITWTAPTMDANEYYTIGDVIYQVDVISSDGADEFGDTVTDTTYTVTGLTSGESYDVHVSTMIFGIGYFVTSSPVTASFNMPAAVVVDSGAGTPLPLAADNTPPTFESAALDEETGVLAITFDEIIANEGFDLSTASHTDTFNVGSQDGTPTGVAFNPDGTKMFVVGYNTEKIYEYTLTTPFDLSSSSYANRSFPVGLQDTTPDGMAFNPDGTKMFVVGIENEKIYEYDINYSL